MKRTIAILLLAVFAVGCSTTKKVDNDPFALLEADENALERQAREIKEAVMALRRVHFAHDSAVLPVESRNAIADAASKLVKYPEVVIYVEGHADQRGENEYNIALGEKRAEATVAYLKHLGISADRLEILSYGEERPLFQGETQIAYAMNRRVEFRLMKGDVELIVEDGMLITDLGGVLITASR